MHTCTYCDASIDNPRRIQCGKPDCIQQHNNARAREFQRSYAAKHGRSHSHRNYTPSIRGHCGRCGKPLNQARNTRPICRACWPDEQRDIARRSARRARCHAKLDTAALGTAATGTAWTQGPCQWCATQFTSRGGSYCSTQCKHKAGKVRRQSAELDQSTVWRWSDFMRMASRFAYCCAYCGMKPDRLDPDHVIPLSRGGSNAIANLLPVCLPCNSDKRDLLLHEWDADRSRRGLAPRVTTWAASDHRYFHLTEPLIRAA